MAYTWFSFSSSLIYLTKVFLCVFFCMSALPPLRVESEEETNHASIFAIAKDADVSQAEFHEALVHEVHWRMNIQSHRCLSMLLVCCLCEALK